MMKFFRMYGTRKWKWSVYVERMDGLEREDAGRSLRWGVYVEQPTHQQFTLNEGLL